jgi:putative heme transporter
MNGVVVGLGAVVLEVPLAVPIAIVTFVTSYIPFFGAFFAGAFAVVIALGAKGLSVALAMLAITLLTNNTLQTCWNRWRSARPCGYTHWSSCW